jgi:hypothetical protein
VTTMDITSNLGVAITVGHLANSIPVTVCDTCLALVRVADIEAHIERAHP